MKLTDLEKQIIQNQKYSFILRHLKNTMNSAPTQYQRKYKVQGMTFDELQNLNPNLRYKDLTELVYNGFVKSYENTFTITPQGRNYLRRIGV
jgi:uncharacterized membrane-anchored protein